MSTEPATNSAQGVLSAEQLQRLKSAALATTVAGAAYAVLFLLSYWLMLDIPGGDASSDELTDYYASTDGETTNIVALYLLPFAGIAFLWFIVTLRGWISLRAHRAMSSLFANAQFASGLVFLSLLFASAAALSIGPVMYNQDRDIPVESVLREFPMYGGSLFFIFATRMGAMFVFTTTRICSGAGLIPRWYSMLGMVVGVVMLLTSSFSRWMIVVFPVWVLVLCVLIQLQARGMLREREADLSTPTATQSPSA